MPALVAGIHVLIARAVKGVDGRDKPGHDGRLYASQLISLYFPRNCRPTRMTAPTPAMVLQNRRVLSQIPVAVRGTMREAVEIRFFCLEATSLLCAAW